MAWDLGGKESRREGKHVKTSGGRGAAGPLRPIPRSGPAVSLRASSGPPGSIPGSGPGGAEVSPASLDGPSEGGRRAGGSPPGEVVSLVDGRASRRGG